MKYFLLSITFVAFTLTIAISQIDYSEVVFQTTSDGIHLDEPNGSDITQLRYNVRSFPDRLDYRFEYLNELSLSADWNRFTSEVINMIEYAYKFDHQWIWNPDHDQLSEDREAFLLNTVQDYVFMLYVTGEPTQYDHLRSICDVVLEYSPSHVDFMTYPAMTYDALGDYEAAETYLHKAEMSQPNNALISLLLAENYEKRGMINAALAYYQKAARFGSGVDATEAQTHIDRLSFK